MEWVSGFKRRIAGDSSRIASQPWEEPRQLVVVREAFRRRRSRSLLAVRSNTGASLGRRRRPWFGKSSHGSWVGVSAAEDRIRS